MMMEFQYKEISRKRCKEIDKWKLQDPYGYGEIFIAENEYFVTNKDESILLCCPFIPRHDDVDVGITQRTYLLVVDQSYYIINFHVDDVKAFDSNHWLITVSILEKDYINENSNELLSILKKVIAVFLNKHRHERIDEHFEYKFYYKGDEI